MTYPGAEDRLNPIAPEGADESTLGGYVVVHGRSPAFEGSDGQPYSVAIETEESEGHWTAYLVFVRWAQIGSTIMGHMETGDLAVGSSEREARAALEALHLTGVKEILDQELARRQAEG